MRNLLFLVLCAFTLAGCGTKQNVVSIKLTSRNPEIFTKAILSNFLSKNKNPAIIIRVPEQNSVISNSNELSLSSTYNSIEKEFMKSGFTVRDRAIFEKIANQGQSSDYTKLQSLTEVDLLIELVDVSNFSVETNKYYDTKKREKVMNTSATFTGKKIEFKVVKLKENEIAGNYTFFFTPCTQGCQYLYNPQFGIFNSDYNLRRIKGETNINPYEVIVSSDMWDDFIKQATKVMIEQMRSI